MKLMISSSKVLYLSLQQGQPSREKHEESCIRHVDLKSNSSSP